MDGVGRSRVLAVSSPDPVMSLLAPMGLAAAAGTALVVDLVGRSRDDGARTLLDVVTDGPRLDEISPGRPGVAIIEGGPIAVPEAVRATEILASRWPAIVVRSPNHAWPGPTAPVHVLYGGGVLTWEHGAAVWQLLGGGEQPPGPGPVIPRVSPRMVRQILAGWVPGPRRWTRAWRTVWNIPWE